MPVRWEAWQSELETLSAFAGEWTEGLAEDFLRNVQSVVARKRAQKESIERLSDDVKRVHGTYRQLLAFFDLERACLQWSGGNCPDDAVERVLAVLADWRERLLTYSGKFPPVDADVRSLAALQTCIREAQCAADVIRAGFGALDAYLAPRVEMEQPAEEVPAPEQAQDDGAVVEAVAPEQLETFAAAPAACA